MNRKEAVFIETGITLINAARRTAITHKMFRSSKHTHALHRLYDTAGKITC